MNINQLSHDEFFAFKKSHPRSVCDFCHNQILGETLTMPCRIRWIGNEKWEDRSHYFCDEICRTAWCAAQDVRHKEIKKHFKIRIEKID